MQYIIVSAGMCMCLDMYLCFVLCMCMCICVCMRMCMCMCVCNHYSADARTRSFGGSELVKNRINLENMYICTSRNLYFWYHVRGKICANAINQRKTCCCGEAYHWYNHPACSCCQCLHGRQPELVRAMSVSASTRKKKMKAMFDTGNDQVLAALPPPHTYTKRKIDIGKPQYICVCVLCNPSFEETLVRRYMWQ